jgi:GH35 family endo-1,4-beta-xylanase
MGTVRAFSTAAVCAGLALGASGAQPPRAASRDVLAHRKGTIVVSAMPGALVRVEQVKHEFRFGIGLTHRRYVDWKSWRTRRRDVPAHRRKIERLEKALLENFNSITPGSEVKWDFIEKRRGMPVYGHMDEAVDWAETHGLTVRGHCLFWGDDRTPEWVKRLRGGELRAVYRRRVKEAVGRYKGRLVDWDFRNETLNGNRWDERMLGKGILARITRWVKEADPDANVCMNEFGVLCSEAKCARYVRTCRSILEHGGVVDCLGCQGHSHGEDFDRGRLKRCLDMLAALRRPILITEFNMPGQTSKYGTNSRAAYSAAREEEKAKEVRDYLRICFEHPAVEGFYFWYPWESCTWIRASALWKDDLTPTPALVEYRKLAFDAWWTRFEGRTDARGECRVPAFFGTHRVSVGGTSRDVRLAKKDGSARVEFAR